MEVKNALGKIIKCIFIFMFLILGFVMRCELFHITSFDSIFSKKPAIYCSIDVDEFSSFINDLENLGDDGVNCIVVTREKNSEIEFDLNIYMNATDLDNVIKDEWGIENSTYKSLLNGDTNINFIDIGTLMYTEFQTNPYIVSMDDSQYVYNMLCDKYCIREPEVIQVDEADMIVLVWGLISVFLIILNVIEIISRKKEIQIRAVYGEDLVHIVIKEICYDFFLFELIYVLARLFVFQFISGDYKSNLAFIIYQLGCAIAIFMNCLYFRNDIKAVFSNVREKKSVLTYIFLLKVLVFFAVTVTVAANMESIKLVLSDKRIETYTSQENEDIFISIDKNQANQSLESDNIWNLLYEDYYKVINPKISCKIADGKNAIIIVNENASNFLSENLKKILRDKRNDEIVILTPRENLMSEEDVNGILSIYQLSGEKYTICQYKKEASVVCVSKEETITFSSEHNPIIIYCSNNVKLSGTMFGAYGEAIYSISEKDLKELDNKLSISKNGYHIVVSRVSDLCEYQNSVIKRMIRFFSSLCILIILLDIGITIAWLNLEYQMDGISYSVKKILGYLFVERNKSFFIRINVIEGLGLGMLCIIEHIIGGQNIKSILWMGAIILLVENIIMMIVITKNESESLVKTLKGGSL